MERREVHLPQSWWRRKPKTLIRPHIEAATEDDGSGPSSGAIKESHPRMSSINIGDIPDMMFDAEINGHAAIAFVDPGASDVFMSR